MWKQKFTTNAIGLAEEFGQMESKRENSNTSVPLQMKDESF